MIRDPDRLHALRRMGLLDSPPQLVFDRLTRLVRNILNVPVALVSLVDIDRQFFLSADGLPEPWATRRETPLSHSFCQHVVATGEILRVDDARTEALVRDNLARTELGVAAYLGAPLRAGEFVLGALCAIDTTPRAWTEAEQAALLDLAEIAGSELALRHLTSELEDRIRDETASRLATRERLSQTRRLEALGQLAGGVAHDFANVLQAVQGGVRVASKLLERDPAAARRLLEAVADAAQRGGSITRRLLAFARRGELRVEQVDVPAVLSELSDVLRHTLLRPGMVVAVETEPGAPPILADRGELEAVVINLATNARDAMPAGGALTLSVRTVTVSASQPRTGLKQGSYVAVTAADTGVGMDAETLARAAEPFFTTKPAGEGTGLGLAMARDFASAAGGAIEIRSEVGTGTTVTLLLPAGAA